MESRARNLEDGITGLLLYKDGSALQVLEGDEELVKNLYDRIRADPRVTNSLVLIQRTTDKREFPNWSMGYKDADESESLFELTQERLSGQLPSDLSPEVDTISRTFARVNGLV